MQNRSRPNPNAASGLMHPDPATLAALVYGELPAKEKAEVESHTAECLVCAGKVAEFQSTLAKMDTWRLPPAIPTERPAQAAWKGGWVKWAAAAALLFGAFLAGQARPSPERSEAAARAMIAPELERGREEILRQVETLLASRIDATLHQMADRQREQLEEFGRKLGASRMADIEGLSSVLREMEEGRVAEMAALRRELETVAVMTEQSLAQTQRHLTTLAAGRPTP